jgi:excinuclease UvrABC ATPase subunit
MNYWFTFHDIKNCYTFDALIEKEHSILVIEHNLDLIVVTGFIDLGRRAKMDETAHAWNSTT